MGFQYIVVKYCNSWDWNDSRTENVCIVTSEEEAKKIMAWLEKNDERFDDITQSYGYHKRRVVNSLESFIELYDKYGG